MARKQLVFTDFPQRISSTRRNARRIFTILDLDTQTESDYTGSRGAYYYTTESYAVTNSEGETEWETREVQHTRWYPAAGHVSRFFDDILIPATKQLDDKQLKKLSGWNLQQLLPYSPSYLAGFKAQRYQVPLEMGLLKAKEEIRSQLKTTVSNDIGGDTQTVSSINTQHLNVTFKHIMLPVWISAYRYKNKQYRVMVNAQTGQVSGDRPYSKVKIAIAVIAGLSILIGGFLLFSNANNKGKKRTYQKTYPMGILAPIQSLATDKFQMSKSFNK